MPKLNVTKLHICFQQAEYMLNMVIIGSGLACFWITYKRFKKRLFSCYLTQPVEYMIFFTTTPYLITYGTLNALYKTHNKSYNVLRHKVVRPAS
jgi:hypothetical protein